MRSARGNTDSWYRSILDQEIARQAIGGGGRELAEIQRLRGGGGARQRIAIK